jgi:hypothetical protein
MGAYTSFAMLALTHHVIVQASAINAGYSTLFTKYCILGDDVVIAESAVALEYVKIMETLGLTIQEGKSINSSISTEFAKGCEVHCWNSLRLVPGCYYTPLGIDSTFVS